MAIVSTIITSISITLALVFCYKYTKAEKELEIVDEYAHLLWGILCDYDGYYDPETKQGSLEGLASLVDESIETCNRIRDRNTTTEIYIGGNGKKYNILHEELK